MSRKSYNQGYFKPRHPEKYVGNVDNIVFRSSWELDFNKFLDNNPNILQWSSEEIFVEYFNPFLSRPAKYYPDYWIKYKNKRGEIVQELLEIKPKRQTTIRARSSDEEKRTYVVNRLKWEAADKFCKQRNITFRILSECQLFK